MQETYGQERWNKEKTDTTAAVEGSTAAVEGAMVETWEYIEDDYVFAFGEAVIAAVQRPETHICIDSGASRSACPIGYEPDLSTIGSELWFIQRQETDAKHEPKPNSVFSREATR